MAKSIFLCKGYFFFTCLESSFEKFSFQFFFRAILYCSLWCRIFIDLMLTFFCFLIPEQRNICYAEHLATAGHTDCTWPPLTVHMNSCRLSHLDVKWRACWHNSWFKFWSLTEMHVVPSYQTEGHFFLMHCPRLWNTRKRIYVSLYRFYNIFPRGKLKCSLKSDLSKHTV